MKSRREILKRIVELKPELEAAEESYFSAVKDKQTGKEISQIEFLKIESEYEIIRKEVETLQWAISIDTESKEERVNNSLSNQEG